MPFNFAPQMQPCKTQQSWRWNYLKDLIGKISWYYHIYKRLLFNISGFFVKIFMFRGFRAELTADI